MFHPLTPCTCTYTCSDERHARLQKKARPHENEDDDDLADEEEDLNDADYDEVHKVHCMISDLHFPTCSNSLPNDRRNSP